MTYLTIPSKCLQNQNIHTRCAKVWNSDFQTCCHDPRLIPNKMSSLIQPWPLVSLFSCLLAGYSFTNENYIIMNHENQLYVGYFVTISILISKYWLVNQVFHGTSYFSLGHGSLDSFMKTGQRIKMKTKTLTHIGPYDA